MEGMSSSAPSTPPRRPSPPVPHPCACLSTEKPCPV